LKRILATTAALCLCSPMTAQAATPTMTADGSAASASTWIPAQSELKSLAAPTVMHPNKGGVGGACSMMSVGARLRSAMCNPSLITNTTLQSKCVKMAAASGFISGVAVAVTTTPLDWPGVTITGAVTFGGTYVFCEVGWL
jgi:hypothetical protein